jgi:proteasome lid subunit RPN8/RPN11
MAVAPFTRIVVDKKEEARFRRRALHHYPMEHLEALWGKVHGDILYIHAFVKVDHKPGKITLKYEDTELDEHEEDAQEAGLSYLGTIHTHPNCNEARFGDTDLEQTQDSSDAVMGICGIQTTKKEKKDGKIVKTTLKRKVVRIEYWPIVIPLIAIRQDTKPSRKSIKPAIKRGYKLAKKKKSRR